MKSAPWWRNTRGEWYVVVQAALLLMVALAPWLDPTRRDAGWSIPALAAGAVLVLLGIVLAAAGLLALGRNLTPLPRPKEGAALVESGAYALVRHPIYTGIILGAFGWALAWRSPATLALAAVLLAFFDVKSRREERWLVEAFPRYADYQRRVKKLLPWLY